MPSYVALAESGQLQRRVEVLLHHLVSCDVCPRACGVDRANGEIGYCASGRHAVVASACAHRGEEPPVSGSRGSGTVFFANCNLRCVFCQNFQISQSPETHAADALSPEELAAVMLRLQDESHCHNINLVSPTHFVPQIVEALAVAIPAGLRLPLVYNTNAYDSADVLWQLDGIVDVYLPDLKYSSDRVASRLSGARDYVAASREAITEMYRQVGPDLVLDGEGTVRRGMIVRHLVLPGGLAGSRESLTWLAKEVSNRVSISIMAQYYPAHKAVNMPVLARGVTHKEYEEVVRLADELGFEHVWVQEPRSSMHYRPDFSSEKHPFERDGGHDV
ncbi:MAG: radical SAM protein [Dehalococcoidia bacterium]|nr:radical SAM protein [Dehalococcoidia bacterium]